MHDELFRIVIECQSGKGGEKGELFHELIPLEIEIMLTVTKPIRSRTN